MYILCLQKFYEIIFSNAYTMGFFLNKRSQYNDRLFPVDPR